jgi:hypothetical protein
MADTGQIDPAELRGKQDKIKELMRRDPKFIGRLITVSNTLGSSSKHSCGPTCAQQSGLPPVFVCIL